ncbi:MFS transporter [Caulobacter sp. KR2-114]|uniref:MFS transporter n=1 Tax=Caulobacter sp. KR2-114 TaxID=3400912 RepID=UPI003C0BCD7B
MAIRISGVPRAVWTLGLVSMFMDISSEMIHSLLPVYLVAGLGASPALLGIIEGVAEATASISKIFSGWLSDRLGRRKLLAVLGYALGAASKPVFPLAVTPFEVLAARFVDRVGKGVRGAPRDALVADVTPPELRGAAFGLRQALDTVGAFTGPLLAVGLMLALHNDVRAVFGWAVIPAVIAVLLLALGVEEPRNERPAASARPPIRWSQVRGMGAPFWRAVGVGVLFTLARISEAFLVLRGRDAGIPLAFIPFVLIAMNLIYALVAAPAGSLSDRIGRRGLLAFGLVALAAAEAVLAWVGGIAGVIVGVGLWGLHMGCTQGLLAALVADTAPADLRGTAFGLFNLASGLAMLAAGALAGALWSAFGAPAAFLTGAAFALATLAGVATLPGPAKAPA